MVSKQQRIAMFTAYDFPTATRADRAGADMTLVGDSLAQVALGYPSTTRLSLDAMVHHCSAVSRGTARPFLFADLPFGTHATPADGVRAAIRLAKDSVHVREYGLRLGEILAVASHIVCSYPCKSPPAFVVVIAASVSRNIVRKRTTTHSFRKPPVA